MWCGRGVGGIFQMRHPSTNSCRMPFYIWGRVDGNSDSCGCFEACFHGIQVLPFREENLGKKTIIPDQSRSPLRLKGELYMPSVKGLTWTQEIWLSPNHA